MRFKIQSLTDVITNSSTSIFQIADDNSINYMKTIINGILLAVGSDKKADDIFDFKILYDEDDVRMYKHYLYDLGYLSEEDYNSDIEDPDKLYLKAHGDPPCIEEYLSEDGAYYNSYLEVTTKDHNADADKLLGVIQEIYYHTAIYDS